MSARELCILVQASVWQNPWTNLETCTTSTASLRHEPSHQGKHQPTDLPCTRPTQPRGVGRKADRIEVCFRFWLTQSRPVHKSSRQTGEQSSPSRQNQTLTAWPYTISLRAEREYGIYGLYMGWGPKRICRRPNLRPDVISNCDPRR